VSRWARNKTKEAVKYVARYEDALIDHARREEVDGVICGHIHKAEIRNVDGISYVNTGDWVESLTCVIEDNDGKLELIDLTDV
jgi:UDP-2,3-diacylglucosamine pyrophosphatase LpxH